MHACACMCMCHRRASFRKAVGTLYKWPGPWGSGDSGLRERGLNAGCSRLGAGEEGYSCAFQFYPSPAMASGCHVCFLVLFFPPVNFLTQEALTQSLGD